VLEDGRPAVASSLDTQAVAAHRSPRARGDHPRRRPGMLIYGTIAAKSQFNMVEAQGIDTIVEASIHPRRRQEHLSEPPPPARRSRFRPHPNVAGNPCADAAIDAGFSVGAVVAAGDSRAHSRDRVSAPRRWRIPPGLIGLMRTSRTRPCSRCATRDCSPKSIRERRSSHRAWRRAATGRAVDATGNKSLEDGSRNSSGEIGVIRGWSASWRRRCPMIASRRARRAARQATAAGW